MISNKYRCIFIHQRKSAGTSVKALFDDVSGADRGLFNDGVLDPRWRRDSPIIRDYYKFTVIRNPWDRFVSGWKYCKSTKHRPLIDVLRNLPRPSLISNVFAAHASPTARYHYAMELLRRTRDTSKHHLRRALGVADEAPQSPGHEYRHITRQQHETVVYADGTLAVDKVVFFESLDAGLHEVFEAIGKPPIALAAHKVRRTDDDYRRHFDPASRALFAEVFRADIETWGYDFDTGLARWQTTGRAPARERPGA